jgi:hypothetical protein
MVLRKCTLSLPEGFITPIMHRILGVGMVMQPDYARPQLGHSP